MTSGAFVVFIGVGTNNIITPKTAENSNKIDAEIAKFINKITKVLSFTSENVSVVYALGINNKIE